MLGGPPPRRLSIIIIPWGGADIGPMGTLPGVFIGWPIDVMGGMLFMLTGGPVPVELLLGGPWLEDRPGGALPGPPPLLSGPTGVPEPEPCVEP